MADQERRDIRITTLFTESELIEIDTWISRQRFALPRSEAMRFLIRQGLLVEEAEVAN